MRLCCQQQRLGRVAQQIEELESRKKNPKRHVEDDLPFSIREQFAREAQRLVDTPKRRVESRQGSKAKAESRKGSKADGMDESHLDARSSGGGPAEQAVLETLESSASAARERSRSKDPMERAAFVAERVAISNDVKGNKRKQMAGKTLKYDACSEQYQKGLTRAGRLNGRNGLTSELACESKARRWTNF